MAGHKDAATFFLPLFTNVVEEDSHSVLGCVVPDIPDFCRELVAALAAE